MSIRQFVLDDLPDNYDYYLAQLTCEVVADSLCALINHELTKFPLVEMSERSNGAKDFADRNVLYTLHPNLEKLDDNDPRRKTLTGVGMSRELLVHLVLVESKRKPNTLFEVLYDAAGQHNIPDFYRMAMLAVSTSPLWKMLADIISTINTVDERAITAAALQLNKMCVATGLEQVMSRIDVDGNLNPLSMPQAFDPDDLPNGDFGKLN